MLTLILLVAAYIPFIIFTINWKLPWEFNTRHCTSGWRRGKCEAGVGWTLPGSSVEKRSALSPLRSAVSRKNWWSQSLGPVFRKFSYIVQLSALGGKMGFNCFSSEVGEEQKKGRSLLITAGVSSCGQCRVGFPSFGRSL